MSEFLDQASAALDRFVRGGGGLTSSGSAQFATLHLVTRALTDVRWAQRAAFEGYPIQAYSLLRPAWEALQLCDLFVAQPELADKWAAGDYKLFTPAKVRSALGEGDKDHFYSFMSERPHPRFAGLQTTIFKRVGDADETGRERAVLHLNDIPIEVSAAYEAIATPGIVLAQIAVHVGSLNFKDPDHKRASLAPTLREVSTALRAGWRAMDAALEDTERNDPDIRNTSEWADEYAGVLDRLATDIDAIYQDESGAAGDGK